MPGIPPPPQDSFESTAHTLTGVRSQKKKNSQKQNDTRLSGRYGTFFLLTCFLELSLWVSWDAWFQYDLQFWCKLPSFNYRVGSLIYRYNHRTLTAGIRSYRFLNYFYVCGIVILKSNMSIKLKLSGIYYIFYIYYIILYLY